MATGPKDYRDPKVTTGGTPRKSSTSWIWWALGILLLLLILAWVMGWFGGGDVLGVVPVTPENTTVAPEGGVVAPAD